MEIEKIKRPILRYHGGKFVLAKWIISYFPRHRIYTESFGGAASVLLQKPRCYCEVYNEMDNEIVNLFHIVREQGPDLKRLLELTPYSRVEFKKSYQKSDNPLEQARRTVVRAFMGFGSAAASGYITGFRSSSHRSGSTPSHDWKNYPSALEFITERLQGVVIENKDSKEVMLNHDSEETLHYLDPPYVLDTRNKGQKTVAYRFEMKNEEHEDLMEFVKSLQGFVIISGYDNEIYNDHLTDWRKEYCKTFADGAAERKEVLWISPNTPQEKGKKIKQAELFD